MDVYQAEMLRIELVNTELKKLLQLAAMSVLLVWVGTAQAHHSKAAYDTEILVDVTGTVSDLEWTSPHARLYVDVVQDDGTVLTWNFELPSPVGLMRKGWRSNVLTPGDAVTVRGFRAKAQPTNGVAQAVIDGDGKALFTEQ